MVPRVHAERLGPARLRELRPGRRGRGVRDDRSVLLAVSLDVLDQRATVRDVDHLEAPADREHRDVALPRLRDERELERVAPRVGGLGLRVDRRAVARGLHVLATAEAERVELVRCGVVRVDGDHVAADIAQRLQVVLARAGAERVGVQHGERRDDPRSHLMKYAVCRARRDR